MTNRFDTDAQTWDDKSHRVKLSDDIAATVRAQIELTPDMDLLDFGCGTGLLSLRFAGEVGSVTGLDNSAGMLEVFRRKAQDAGLGNVATIQLDLNGGNHLNRKFDLIISAMAFHHVKNIDPVISELVRGLNPGGRLCIADLDPDHGLFHADNTGVEHYGFEREFMIETFEKAGLTNVFATTAASMTREGEDGVERTFSIFLVTGRL